jgi:hypothetical protein
MILTDAKVRNAKPQEKDYRLTDGHGLHLYVKANGTKLWRWRYEFNGKEKLMSFGAYPEVTIAAARTAHDRARKVLDSGVDPMVEKKKEHIEIALEEIGLTAIHPFSALALDWFDAETNPSLGQGKNQRSTGNSHRRSHPANHSRQRKGMVQSLHQPSTVIPKML